MLTLNVSILTASVRTAYFFKMGLTGFDRMRGGVCQHAGSWDESLKR